MNRVLSIFAIIAAVSIFFGYVDPTWTGHIADTKAAIAADDAALSAAASYTAQQKKLTDERNQISKTDLTAIGSFLPDSIDNVGLILDLNALAARSGLLVSNIDVASNSTNSSGDTGSQNASGNAAGALPSGTANSPVGSVDLSLSASGTFGNFMAFLQSVEQSVRILDVRSLSVKGSDTGVYDYKMTIRIYWLR